MKKPDLRVPVKRLDSNPFISPLLMHVADSLNKGVTVTRFELHAADGPGQAPMAFEIRVTQLGKTKLPRLINLAPDDAGKVNS